ncbi:MAG: acyltransferase [Candidatus Eisenbacteria bacterium]|nr:acyltransferase [Candidatus Eisenbacteria bacterium]
MIRVAAVQTHPRFGARAENLERAAEMIRSVRADLYLLPELFNTGYIFRDRAQCREFAEPFPDGESCRFIAELSAERDAVILGGFAEATPHGALYNAAMAFQRGEPLGCYRKIQLFDREFDWFDPGDRPPGVIESAAGRLGPMICFDWIFPEVARCLAVSGAQILVHATNLVLPFCQDATMTRCVENRVFSVLANRIGQEARGDYELTFTGRSQITSPRGERLAQASEDREEVIVAQIDPAEADEKGITERNDLLRDRRPGLYRALWS